MAINPQLTISELKELRELTSDEFGAQRVAWSPTWLKAREWFQSKLSDLPVKHHYDAAGNHWTTLKGESERALILGSHLDSVPNGGWLDGALGVLSGLAVLRRINEQYNGNPPVTIRLVDWADEEGARFGRSLFGSSAFAGNHTIELDRHRVDREGFTLSDAMWSCGFSIDNLDAAQIERENAAAYLELHIEQGPVLESIGLPLGVVTGTKGVERHNIIFKGQEAHSGSTPMSVRRDALAAAARFTLETYPIAQRHSDAVCTVGSLKTRPGIVTAVVGEAELTLDQRDLHPAILNQMLEDAKSASEQFAEEHGCTVVWSKILSIEPVPFHAELIRLCDESVREISGQAKLLPSGPLHDAAEVARVGIPTVMMFVQSLRGISHNRIENTSDDHLSMAIIALDNLADRTIDWIVSQP